MNFSLIDLTTFQKELQSLTVIQVDEAIQVMERARLYVVEQLEKPSDRDEITQIIFADGSSLDMPSRAISQIQKQLFGAIVSLGRLYELSVAKFGYSIYSYRLWFGYMRLLNSLTVKEREHTSSQYLRDVVSKVHQIIPLAQSTLHQIIIRRYMDKSSDADEDTHQYLAESLKLHEMIRQTQIPLVQYEYYLQLFQLEMQFCQLKREFMPPKYVVSRLFYIFSCCVEQCKLPICYADAAFRIMNFDTTPYVNIVSELFKKNVDTIYLKKELQETNIISKRELALFILQQGMEFYNNDVLLQTVLAYSLKFAGRHDAMEAVLIDQYQQLQLQNIGFQNDVAAQVDFEQILLVMKMLIEQEYFVEYEYLFRQLAVDTSKFSVINTMRQLIDQNINYFIKQFRSGFFDDYVSIYRVDNQFMFEVLTKILKIKNVDDIVESLLSFLASNFENQQAILHYLYLMQNCFEDEGPPEIHVQYLDYYELLKSQQFIYSRNLVYYSQYSALSTKFTQKKEYILTIYRQDLLLNKNEFITLSTLLKALSLDISDNLQSQYRVLVQIRKVNQQHPSIISSIIQDTQTKCEELNISQTTILQNLNVSAPYLLNEDDIQKQIVDSNCFKIQKHLQKEDVVVEQKCENLETAVKMTGFKMRDQEVIPYQVLQNLDYPPNLPVAIVKFLENTKHIWHSESERYTMRPKMSENGGSMARELVNVGSKIEKVLLYRSSFDEKRGGLVSASALQDYLSSLNVDSKK